VRGFSQLLARDYEGRLDTQADEYLGFINDGASRMQSLVDALLTYSRVGSETAPHTFPLREAVDDALANLRSMITVDARIDVDELPSVTADKGQLVQVLQNLFANALKFHSDAPPIIRVSAEAEAGRWIISVRDNGIGIDPRFRRQIFHMFQRLHARDEYEGTGVGLAICKKLVEGWGGWIWVESEPGAGATFRFTIRGEAP
jgi:light-regulated signal transduction histidine kinase (bacteriophytochrome)